MALERLARAHKASGTQRPFRVWSAACSTGEEVWSIVAALRTAGFSAEECEVLGTDINPDVVERARAGEYRRWSMRGVAAGSTEAWLDVRGDVIRVKDDLRAYARFAPRNLMTVPYPDDWDVIFCRNVLIYLRPDAVQQVFQASFDALRPGGALFVAATDPVPGAEIGFEETCDGATRRFGRPDPAVVARPTRRPVPTSRVQPAPATRRKVANRRRSAATDDDRLQAARARLGARRSRPASAVSEAPSSRVKPVRTPTRSVRTATRDQAASRAEAPPVDPSAEAVMHLSRARGGRPRRALAQLADLVETHPEDVMIQLAMAEISLGLGLGRVALTHARAAFFLKPDDIMPNYWVGAAGAAAGRVRFGQARMRKARTLLAKLPAGATVPLSGSWSKGEVQRRLDDAA